MSILMAPVKSVWRGLQGIARRVSNRRDRILLSARLLLRRQFPDGSNVFSTLMPADIPVFVINLTRRSDRLRDVRANLKTMGFTDVRVIEALDGPATYPHLPRGYSANLGCTQSHRVAIDGNLRVGQPVAVCEDDNEFLAPKDEVQALIDNFLKSAEYDVLCLSARVRSRKVQASKDFNVVSWAIAPAFYIAKPRARAALLWAYGESVRRLSRQLRKGPFDQVWQSVQRYRLMFITPVARVARQKESYSDIQDKFFAGT
jgi:hypothetical protein